MRRSDADKPSIPQRTVHETGMIEQIRILAASAKPHTALMSRCRAVRDRVDYF
jgi:hypothetical protein